MLTDDAALGPHDQPGGHRHRQPPGRQRHQPGRLRAAAGPDVAEVAADSPFQAFLKRPPRARLYSWRHANTSTSPAGPAGRRRPVRPVPDRADSPARTPLQDTGQDRAQPTGLRRDSGRADDRAVDLRVPAPRRRSQPGVPQLRQGRQGAGRRRRPRLDLHHQARPAGHDVLERHVRHRVTAAVVRRDRGGPDPVRPGAAHPGQRVREGVPSTGWPRPSAPRRSR